MKKLAICTVLLAIVAGFSCQEIAFNSISGVPEGRPGIDYPNLTEVPRKTTFFCRDRQPGFYADPSTRCQVWHWCDTFGIRHSFICPNMTVFNQQIRGCDWWYNVNCDLAISQYVNNDELYKPGPIFKRLKQNHARVEASSSDDGAFSVASHEDRLVTEEANAIHPTTRPVLHDSFFDITRPTFTPSAPSAPTTPVLSTQGTIAPAPNVFNNNLGNQQPSVHFRPLRPFLRSFRPSTLSPIPDNSGQSVNIASLPTTISQSPPPPPPPPPQQTFSQSSPPPPPPVPQQAVFIGFNRLTPRPQDAQNSIQRTVFQRLPHQSFFRPSTPDHQIFQVSTTTQPTNPPPTQFQPAITPNQFNQPSTQFHSGSQQQFFHTTSQAPIPQPVQHSNTVGQHSQQTSFPQEPSTTQPPIQFSQSSFPLNQFEQSRTPQPHFQQLSTLKPQFQQSNTRQPQAHQFQPQFQQHNTLQPQFQPHSTPQPHFQQPNTPQQPAQQFSNSQPQFQPHSTPQPHFQQPSTQQPAQQFSSPQPQFQRLSTTIQPQQFNQFGTKQQFPVSRTPQVQFQTPNTSQQTFQQTSFPQPSSIVESTSPIHEQFQHSSAPAFPSTPPGQTFTPQAVTSPQPSPHQLVIQRASPQPILAQNLQRGNQPFFKPAFRFFTPSSPPPPPPPPPPAPVTPQTGFTSQTSGVSIQSNGAPPSFINTNQASVTPDSQDLFSPEVTTAFESFGSKVTDVNNDVESGKPSPGPVATTTAAPITTIRPPLSLPPTPNSFSVESVSKIVSSTVRPTFPAFRTTTPPRPQHNENDADFDPFAHLPFGARLPALAKTRSNNEESAAGSAANHIEISARPPLQNDISNGRTRPTITTTTTTTARTTPIIITTQRPRRASIITAPAKAATVATTPSITTSTAVVRATNKPILITGKRRINRKRTSSTFPVTTYKPTNTFIPTTAQEFQSSTVVSDSGLVNFGDVIANGDDSSNLESAQTSIGNIAIN